MKEKTACELPWRLSSELWRNIYDTGELAFIHGTY